MALQTKVYTKTSNTFTLELTLVENSTSTAGNTSSISYTLKLKSTTKNFAQYGVGAKVELDGKTVAVRDRGSAPKITLGTYSEVTLLSGTATVAHNNDGSKSMAFAYSLDMASASYTPGPMNGSGSMALTTIPREAKMTSAPNFTDEDNPTIQFSNPAGFPVYAYIEVREPLSRPIEERKVSGSSYTFRFTEAERNVLRSLNLTSNTQAVRFVVRTDMGGYSLYSWIDRTLTIKNPAPTLSPSIKDVNSSTIALTGNSSVMVRYASKAQVTTGAKAVKFATIKSQSVKCGGKSLSGNGTISGPESGDFVFSVTDSRGNTTTQTVKKSLVPYINPTCYIGKGVPNALGEFNLSVSGDCFNGNFGVANNQITVEFRFAAKGTSIGDDWMPMTVNPAGNSYTATANIEGLDYRTTYIFQARVTDLLGTVESATKIVVSRPLAEWGEDYWKFNVPVSVAEIDDEGEESVYSLLGAAKALSTQYQLDTVVTKGEKYKSVTGYAQLVGNSVRCNIFATRSSNTGTGNIGNEAVCSFTIQHGGKIKNFDSVSFVTGASGGGGFFQMEETANSGTTVTFKVTLAAAASALNTFNAYFIVPVTLDFSKF